MDFFNKKKLAKLERQLSLKEVECSSLKSDLEFLERENHELKNRLGENSKVVASVKSSKPSFISIKRAPVNSADKQSQTSNQAVKGNGHDLILGGAMGGLVSSALSNGVDSDTAEE